MSNMNNAATTCYLYLYCISSLSQITCGMQAAGVGSEPPRRSRDCRTDVEKYGWGGEGEMPRPVGTRPGRRHVSGFPHYRSNDSSRPRASRIELIFGCGVGIIRRETAIRRRAWVRTRAQAGGSKKPRSRGLLVSLLVVRCLSVRGEQRWRCQIQCDIECGLRRERKSAGAGPRRVGGCVRDAPEAGSVLKDPCSTQGHTCDQAWRKQGRHFATALRVAGVCSVSAARYGTAAAGVCAPPRTRPPDVAKAKPWAGW